METPDNVVKAVVKEAEKLRTGSILQSGTTVLLAATSLAQAIQVGGLKKRLDILENQESKRSR